MSGKVAPPAEMSREAPKPPSTDVRASRLYVFSRGPISSLVRRAFSVVALVALDTVGLAIGIYLALVFRELLAGDGDVPGGSSGAVPGFRLLGARPQLAAVLDEVRPDEVILTEADFEERAVLDVVEHAHRRGIKVRLAPDTTELLVQRGEYVPGQGAPLFELRPPVLTGWDWAVKRGFDLVVSALVVVIGLAVWALIALAIKLDSRGPIFFVDRRIGVGEREFGMLKFRTMVAEAPALQPRLEAENEAEGALFKIREDPRVTRVGRFLRRFSLDEIPQVANVLRGEMSLVGPRPLPLRDYQLLEDWHRRRYAVLPGMTGLWQISGRSGLSFDDLVRLDFTYIENWSIWLDISITVKTIPAVITRRGAY
jgi:exopolysaccharide biosynthesis polyprenyl glycosylphosphotransferase